MKQGPSGAKKQGTMIALACAAVFAAPLASAQVFTPDFGDGKGLTLGIDFLIGVGSKGVNGATGGPASNTVRRTEVFSSSSDIWLKASEKLNGDFIQGWGLYWQSSFDGDEYNRRGSTEGDEMVLGMRSTAGSFFVGTYSSPYKQIGSAFWAAGSSWGNGMSQSQVLGNPGFRVGTAKGARCGDAEQSPGIGTTDQCVGPTGSSTVSATATMGFYRQNSNTINWYSPNWNGFKAYAQWVPSDTDIPAGTDAATQRLPNPRDLEGAVTYTNGPFTVGAVYVQHRDYMWGKALTANKVGFVSLAAGAGESSSDTGKLIGASYTMGDYSIRGAWQRMEYSQSGRNTATGVALDPNVNLTDLSVDSWYLGARIHVSGPHNIAIQYAQASNNKCNSGYVSANIAASGQNPCDSTGMVMYGIGYNYIFSKQFKIFLSASKMDNERNAFYSGHGATKLASNIAGANIVNYTFGMVGAF